MALDFPELIGNLTALGALIGRALSVLGNGRELPEIGRRAGEVRGELTAFQATSPLAQGPQQTDGPERQAVLTAAAELLRGLAGFLLALERAGVERRPGPGPGGGAAGPAGT